MPQAARLADLARKTLSAISLLAVMLWSLGLPASAQSSVMLSEHCDYGGYRVTLGEGAYSLRQLTEKGIQNDDVSAVAVPPGYVVKLYEHDNFKGRSQTLTSSSKCLVATNFNDIVSSVTVSRKSAPQAAAAPSTAGLKKADCVCKGLCGNGYTGGDKGSQSRGVSPANLGRYLDPDAIQTYRQESHVRSRVSGWTCTAQGFSPPGAVASPPSVTPKPRGPSGVTAATVTEHCDYGGYSVKLSPGTYTLAALNQRGIKNDDLSAISITSGYEAVIYEHDNFQGRSLTLTGSKACLVPTGFNDIVSSIVIRPVTRAAPPPRTPASPPAQTYTPPPAPPQSYNPPPAPPQAPPYVPPSQPTPTHGGGQISMTQHCDFGGYRVALPAGSYRLSDLTARGILNDDVSALDVPPGMEVIVFEHDNFQGRSMSLKQSTSCLVPRGFNDIISSAIVRTVSSHSGGGHSAPSAAVATLTEHCDHGGYQVALTPGNYRLSDLTARGMRNDDISAVAISPGYEVVIYEHDHFQGRSQTLAQSVSCLVPSGFNDIVSSAQVRPASTAQISEYDQCLNSIDGRVAWDQKGNTTWNPVNIRKLCAGTTNHRRTISCFQGQIASGQPWNGAIDVCSGG